MVPVEHAPAGESGKTPVARPMRVLVIDDERDTVLMLVAVLRTEGYDAKGVYSGKAAFAAFQEFEPDVVISDIAMPDMTGWEVAKRIRQAGGRQLPLLIGISGEHMQAADRRLANLVGFDYYFYKPCDPKVLLTLLERLKPTAI